MIPAQFLGEWALRSSVLIVFGGLILRSLKVKNPSIRLAVWTAMLCGCLLMPLLTTAVPPIRLPVGVAPVQPPDSHAWPQRTAEKTVTFTRTDAGPASNRFEWPGIAMAIYLVVVASLLLRLCIGLALSRRLLSRSRPVGRNPDGSEIRESDGVAAPVALGLVRPVIVLPGDWRGWDAVKLAAVLAHEQSHIDRWDPAVQLLSTIHRAFAWHSPLSWFLHRAIVRTAEEASDDAAVAVCDRVSYAEILMDFMRVGGNGLSWQGVAMARYTRPETRIHRILDGTVLSQGVTRWRVATILTLGLSLGYVIAALHAQQPSASIAAAGQTAQAAPPAPPRPAQPPLPPSAPEPPEASVTTHGRDIQRYMVVLGDDTISGSWNSEDALDAPERLRAEYGHSFAWFRRSGHAYVVTDAGVMAELDKAMQPQKEVNRMQAGVNAEQAKVNSMQGVVNTHQDEVNKLQSAANRRQDLANRIQAAIETDDNQALIRKLENGLAELRAAKENVTQDEVNRRQSQVNGEQARVNAQQGIVNEMQRKVNEQQSRVSAEYNRRIPDIFDSALRRHIAREL